MFSGGNSPPFHPKKVLHSPQVWPWCVSSDRATGQTCISWAQKMGGLRPLRSQFRVKSTAGVAAWNTTGSPRLHKDQEGPMPHLSCEGRSCNAGCRSLDINYCFPWTTKFLGFTVQTNSLWVASCGYLVWFKHFILGFSMRTSLYKNKQTSLPCRQWFPPLPPISGLNPHHFQTHMASWALS